MRWVFKSQGRGGRRGGDAVPVRLPRPRGSQPAKPRRPSRQPPPFCSGRTSQVAPRPAGASRVGPGAHGALGTRGRGVHAGAARSSRARGLGKGSWPGGRRARDSTAGAVGQPAGQGQPPVRPSRRSRGTEPSLGAHAGGRSGRGCRLGGRPPSTLLLGALLKPPRAWAARPRPSLRPPRPFQVLRSFSRAWKLRFRPRGNCC